MPSFQGTAALARVSLTRRFYFLQPERFPTILEANVAIQLSFGARFARRVDNVSQACLFRGIDTSYFSRLLSSG
jgi:hypothetical protein